MSIKKVFKSYIPSLNYVTQKGRTCVFQEGKFLTDVPEEIAELNALVESKSNPHIFIDPNESEIDTEVQDRIKAAAAKAVLDEMEKIAEEKKAGNPQQPQSAAQTGKAISPAALLNVASTASMGQMAAQSNQK